MQDIDDQAYVLHASVCQTLANPTRLKILNALRDQEIPVAELARRTGTSMPNLSQHLAILRQRRVVLTRRQGVTIHYRIANPKILQAFDIMREVLFEQLSEGRRLVAAVNRARRGGARR
ncbi:MAG: winged helix-turn-helix transcriptional regulator [Candidatus Rokubacteria bacterium]|nr:winged helix-turn-helix transcriptional regulator [Candidatus Rokubacteria bacterium]MBI2015866.1 winged helix-turn-helix transcriptional regulator [Candidatus Rokubacteria bacterium]MBI2155855.1 winged helix-turn-helix transcriptional regulator [Candidatus Rokubacteria bacterium]MBI2491216.1 winged helix-turn-helix transcriptional regulator [Candidatus Rokubacteria bacterium]